MTKTELELLELEALLEASANVAEQLKLAGYNVVGDTVLELCRRLRGGREVLAAIAEHADILVASPGVSVDDWLEIINGDFGV